MKKINLLLSFFFLSGFSIAQQWQQTNGPMGGMVNTIIKDHSGNFYAGTLGGVFKSSDNGINWVQMNNGLTGTINSATQISSLCESTNGHLFAGAPDGLFHSTNGGANWNHTQPIATDVRAIAVKQNVNIFVGCYVNGNYGILRSTDDGNNWTFYNIGFIIFSFVFDSAGAIYVGTNGGIFKSIDNGQNWVQINNTLKGISALTVNNAGVIFAAAGPDGVCRSTDNGNSWAQIDSGLLNLADRIVYSVGVDSSQNILLGSRGGIFRSTNNGDSWNISSSGINDAYLGISSLIISSGGLIMASNGGGAGIYRSTDNGQTWLPSNNGLRCAQIKSLSINTSGNVFAGTEGGVFRSIDNGNTWVNTNTGITNTSINSVFCHPNGTVFAGTFRIAGTPMSGIFRSTDNGATWLPVNMGLQGDPFVYGFAYNKNAYLFAAMNDYVYRSANNGDTWTQVKNGITNFLVWCIAANANGDVFAGTNRDGIFRSTNNGDTWTPVNNGLTSLAVKKILINKVGYIFAASDGFATGDGGGVFRSIDNGNSWTQVLGNSHSSSLTQAWDIATNTSGDIFVTQVGGDMTNIGIWRSSNNGLNWTQMNSGLADYRPIYSLAIDPLGNAYAGSWGSGIWKTNVACPATPVITANGATTFCSGDSTVLTSSAGSGNQWYFNGSKINGATNSTYTATASGIYSVVDSANNCISDTSNKISVNVHTIPATPTITSKNAATFCQGLGDTLVSNTNSGNQWFLNGTVINGATGVNYVATAGGNYTVIASNGGCTSAASAATVVVVNALPSIPTISNNRPLTFCSGDSTVLSSSVSSGNQWLLNGVAISGATNTSYTVKADGNYTVQNTNSNGCSAISAATTITVNALPTVPNITTTNNSAVICSGNSLTLTSSAGSGNQWYLNGTAISGATNTTYTATGAGNYTVQTTNSNGCTSLASIATTVTVNALPSTPTISAGSSTTFCTGGNVVLTSSAGSGNQWLLNGANISGATNTTYTATGAGNYTVQTTNSNGCISLASIATTITVNALPSTPTISAGSSTTFCTGGSVVLTSSAGSGNQWLLNGANISGATNTTYTATGAGNYTVQTTNSNGCTSVASIATTVSVNALPSTPTISAGSSTTFCAGGSVVLTSSAGSGNQWLLNGANISGATNTTYTATGAGNYTVQTTNSNGCTSVASIATTVSVNALPSTPTISAGSSTTFCAGGSVILTSSAATNNQWYLNGTAISGATSTTYTANASGNYTVQTTNSNGCTSAASGTITITVNPIPAKPTITRDVNNNLVSSSSTGNQWFNSSGAIGSATNQTYKPSTDGSYFVQVTQNGCTSPNSDAYYYLVTAVTNLNTNETVNIYPNPVSDILRIDYKLININNVTAQLYDINGVKLLEKAINSGSSINLSNYANGHYTLQLVDNKTHKLLYNCHVIKSK